MPDVDMLQLTGVQYRGTEPRGGEDAHVVDGITLTLGRRSAPFASGPLLTEYALGVRAVGDSAMSAGDVGPVPHI